MSGIEVGAELPRVSQTADLPTLVGYAGASGDLNPLHFDRSFARRVSPTGDLIAHGMLAMAVAARALAGFAGGPENVREISVRFARPWPVDTTAVFGGTVTSVEEGTAKVALWGETESGTRILRGQGRIVV